MNILVTAGPTREPIDPVRYISNRSSGKMGYAIAEVAASLGHRVDLVSGPVSLTAPSSISLTRVVTAAEMCAAVVARVAACDVLIMCAAVADSRPVKCHAEKVKKEKLGRQLELEPTPDILKSVASMKGDRFFIGFAAETENLEAEALRKLSEKSLDMIVANDVGSSEWGMESDRNKVLILTAAGGRIDVPPMSKRDVAHRILQGLPAPRTIAQDG